MIEYIEFGLSERFFVAYEAAFSNFLPSSHQRQEGLEFLLAFLFGLLLGLGDSGGLLILGIW